MISFFRVRSLFVRLDDLLHTAVAHNIFFREIADVYKRQVDILTLKQLLGHSNVSTTQIYTHLQEFQVRAAIEENPLGKVKKPKAASHVLDTTEQATGELQTEQETVERVEDSSAPMAAFEGADKDGIGLDAAALAMAQNDDAENRNG